VAAAKHLAEIAEQEGIKASNDALGLIASYGKGSFRDSISLLDQLASSGRSIELETVRSLLGVPADTAVSQLIEAMHAGQSDRLLALLQDLRASGIAPATIAEEVARQLRDAMVRGSLPAGGESLVLLDKLIEVPAKSRPYDYLELALLSVSLSRHTTVSQTQTPIASPPAAKTQLPNDIQASEAAPKTQSAPAQEVPTTVAKKPRRANADTQLDDKVWNAVLNDIKKNYATIYGIMRMSRPQLAGNELLLEFGFPFHHKQINQATNRQKIATIVANHLGEGITITTAVNSDLNTPEMAPESKPEPAADNYGSITNIFGGAEVLES
jgi:DNA polymerase-3 subunit gamma/tau